ncbi:hypothetical protein EJB05_38597, partial [Eragrostis curvula]
MYGRDGEYGGRRGGFGSGRNGRGAGRTTARIGFEHREDWQDNSNSRYHDDFQRRDHGFQEHGGQGYCGRGGFQGRGDPHGRGGFQGRGDPHGHGRGNMLQGGNFNADGNQGGQIFHEQYKEDQFRGHGNQQNEAGQRNDKNIQKEAGEGTSKPTNSKWDKQQYEKHDSSSEVKEKSEESKKWIPKETKVIQQQDAHGQLEDYKLKQKQRSNSRVMPMGNEADRKRDYVETGIQGISECNRCAKKGHTERNCPERKPWEYIAPLVGFAVPGQGFFFIEDIPSEQGVKDMASCAVIQVLEGELTPRQIENEFKILAGPSSNWRWYAKKIGENHFQMRFPTAKKVEELSHFTEMRLRTVPTALIKLTKWDSAIEAKGQLDVAWFRVKGIPIDKRSEANIFQVASMVGLPLGLDKNNIHKFEFYLLWWKECWD